MADDKKESQKRVRSPGFPFIGLKKAITRAEEFHKKENRVRNWANMKVAVDHWGFKENSSGGKQTVAALVAYGLLQSTGSGDSRQLRLSDSALDIIVDKNEPSRAEALREALKKAALRPKLHRELWDKYNGNLPSDGQLRYFLLREHEPPFNDRWVDHFISEFRGTLDFAKLSGSDTIPEESEDKIDPTEGGDDQMQKAEQGQQHSTPKVPPPPEPNAPYLTFPLPRGNAIEIRLRSKVSASEFDRLKQLFELMRDSVIEE